MFLDMSNQAKRLLFIGYIQRVRPEEIRRECEDVKTLLAGLAPGFRLLVDLSQLELFEPGCEPEIGRLMELIDRAGVELVVRVIPDADKDIGLNILGAFHYPHHPRFVTCCSLAEAMQALSL